MRKIAVMLYGPPGSGKGTQADLVARELGLIHFDTGRFCESVVHDPAREREKIIRREQALFDNGILMTPSFVVKEVVRQVRRIAGVGLGVAFSGSPRTLYEAERLLPVLEKLYGKGNVFAVTLKVPDAVSIRRNAARVLCSVCRSPLLTAYYPSKNPKHCPVCAGPFYRRTLDRDTKTIAVRLGEYRNRTEPVFSLLAKRRIPRFVVDGKLPPYKVFRAIIRKIGGKR